MILTSILFLLFSNAVTLRRDIAILFNRIVILIFMYSILNVITEFSIFNNSISLHGGLLYINNITQIFQIFILIITILILNLTSFFPEVNLIGIKISTYKRIFRSLILRKEKIPSITEITNDNQQKIKHNEHLKIIEYPLILLFIIAGAIFLISTNDLISIFLAIELQSYGLYLLSTINRNSELSTTGGLIYFLLGGLSSCFILLGTSLLYANSGTTNIEGFFIITSISDNSNINDLYKPYYISFSLLIFSIGFLFKISAAPFHFWSPDVYDAIPTIVTTFVTIIAKISIFIFLLELVYYTSNYILNFNWTFSLLMSSFFSLIIGTIVGLTQFRIKRLLAYSTISHVGFILLALSISSIESTQAFLFYLIQYSISNLNIFFILILIGYTLYHYISINKEYNELLEKNYSPVQLISQLKGYFYINPILSLSLVITIFSFIGIPPLIGFFAKQMVLSAALDKGFIFLTLIAIITSVIGAVYYLNIVKEIFFSLPLYKLKSFKIVLHNDEKNDILNKYIFNKKLIEQKTQSIIYLINIKTTYKLIISNVITIVISIITLLILLFIFINKEWLSMGTILVQILFNY